MPTKASAKKLTACKTPTPRNGKPAALPRKTGRPTEIDPNTLLDAAELLFSESGFDGTTTREVVKLAKCNIALISYHFGGKEGLYQAVLVRHFERLRHSYSIADKTPAILEREWPELKAPDQRMFCAAIFELSKSIAIDSPMQKIICREMMTGAAKMAKALSRSEGGVYRLISLLVADLQKSGSIREDVELPYAVVGLIGPMIYSCIAAPILKEVYGFRALDQAYVRGLCFHLTRVFFEGCGNKIGV